MIRSKFPILSFYNFPDTYIQDCPPDFSFSGIFCWNDNTLETKHDYIQWYFPLMEASNCNPTAPVLSKQELAYIRQPNRNKYYRKLQLKAFDRMLKFLGLKRTWWGGITFPSEELPNWINIHGEDHNYLRITRMITSLRLFGNDKYATRLYESLNTINGIFQDKWGAGIFSTKTLTFWKDAATANLNLD